MDPFERSDDDSPLTLVGIEFLDAFRAQEFLTATTRLAANGHLRLRDARDRPWPLRLIERLGIGRGRGTPLVQLEWRSERPVAADGRVMEFVAVELPADAAGDYVLELEVADTRGRHAAAVRRFEVVKSGS